MTLAGSRFSFAACGEDVTIYEWVRILDPERITIGDHVIIDDFVFLQGRGGIRIGDHVHIATYVSVVGGGFCDIGDFVNLSAGSRLITGTDVMDGSGLNGPTIPSDLRAVHRGHVRIGAHAIIATNSVVQTDVEIGEGTIVGAGSVVTRSLPPWTICYGAPARPMKDRPRDRILELARQLRAREGKATL
jgi:acetyltransferase-like isoleucine patch superfamily enzyme